MKRSEPITLTVQMTVADALNTLGPQIDEIVTSRVAELQRREEPRRLRAAALDYAIREFVNAVSRFESAQHSPGERVATDKLIVAAKRFHRVYRKYKKGF